MVRVRERISLMMLILVVMIQVLLPWELLAIALDGARQAGRHITLVLPLGNHDLHAAAAAAAADGTKGSVEVQAGCIVTVVMLLLLLTRILRLLMMEVGEVGGGRCPVHVAG